MVLNLCQFEDFMPTKTTIAVMGSPIAHSLSPALHSEFAKEMNLDFDYIALEITPDEFPRAVELAKEKLCGFNLTMPLKQQVIPYLDVADDEVLLTESANTVVVRDGKLYGYTTDGIGLRDVLLMEFDTLQDAEILILGAGGAARSIASSLIKSGAHVTVAVRNREKGEAFATALSCEFVMFDSIPDKFDILINATPVGMGKDDSSPIDISSLSQLKFVYDCIYNPPMPKLLRDAKNHGKYYDSGLSMLVMQGAYAEKHWFNISIPADVCKKNN